MSDLSLAGTGLGEAGDGEAPASSCEPDLHPRRRRWPASDKARIVAESFVPGASVNAVAMHHGVDASTLSSWRRQAVRGELGPVPGIAAVPAVVPLVLDECAAPTSAPVASPGGHATQRRWPVSEKARIVAESFAPGGSIRSVAARHGVATSTLADWRGLARKGRLGALPEAAASATDAAVPMVPRIDGGTPVPSAAVSVEVGAVVVRLPWDCPVERIVAVASGLERAR